MSCSTAKTALSACWGSSPLHMTSHRIAAGAMARQSFVHGSPAASAINQPAVRAAPIEVPVARRTECTRTYGGEQRREWVWR